jgi:hypothetical protein
MPIFAKRGKNFIPSPEGLWQGVCVDVEDLGLQQTSYGEKDKVRLTFQITERTSEGRRHAPRKPFTNTLHEKSTLRRYVEVLEGRSLSTKELQDYDLETLLGKNCQVQVEHAQGRDGQTYANVQTIVPLSKGTPPIEPEQYVRVVHREK